MVPTARATHFNHVHVELAVKRGHPAQFVRCARGAGSVLQLVPVHPGDQRQRLLAADRAGHLARPAVEFRRPQQVGAGVADLGGSDAARVDLGEQRSALQRVVHHLPLGSHVQQRTWRACLTDRPFGSAWASSGHAPCSAPQSASIITCADVSRRYSEVQHRSTGTTVAHDVLARRWVEVTRDRIRHPRLAARGADARLRATQTLGQSTRCVPGVLLRLAVPGTAPVAASRADRRGGRRTGR